MQLNDIVNTFTEDDDPVRDDRRNPEGALAHYSRVAAGFAASADARRLSG